MPIEFGAPASIWFRLYARSEGNYDIITSLATASFTGAILAAFDANMNPIGDYSYGYLAENPEPWTWLGIAAGMAVILLKRRRAV